MQVRGKAMASKAGDMMEVARDVLLTARLDDQPRFTQVSVGGGGREGERAAMGLKNMAMTKDQGWPRVSRGGSLAPIACPTHI